jgi:beta-lactam-binding protein with PASTA domain
MADADASTHRARSESAPPEIVLQMVTSFALTILGEVLGSSLTGKLLAGALGALLGAFLTARGSHHTRRIVAVALLLALLDALRGAASALASTATRGIGRNSTHHSGQGDAPAASLTAEPACRSQPGAWVPRRPTLTLAVAVAGFAAGTGTIAVAQGLKNSTRPIQGTPKVIYARLPDVIGRDVSNATAILAAHGFPAEIHRHTGLHGARRRVLAQSPSPGESKPRGSTVVLTVAAGPSGISSVLVPSVVGLPAQQAIKLLEHQFGTRLVRVPSSVTNDQVLTQAPLPGTISHFGSVVLLTVSSGASRVPLVTVPALTGLTAEEAHAILKATGLGTGPISEPSEKIHPGLVIDSTPTAGTSVEKGSTVTLKISTGARPEPPSRVTVPALVGLTIDEAEAMLKATGLAAERVSEPSEKVHPGVVIDSTPTAGTSVEKGATVTLKISGLA